MLKGNLNPQENVEKRENFKKAHWDGFNNPGPFMVHSH